MKLETILENVHLVPCFQDNFNKDVSTVYIGDLLSFVMANGIENAMWITVQRHINVIAVAQLNDFSCIVFVEGVEPDEQTIQKALELHIPLFMSQENAYALASLLHDIGL